MIDCPQLIGIDPTWFSCGSALRLILSSFIIEIQSEGKDYLRQTSRRAPRFLNSPVQLPSSFHVDRPSQLFSLQHLPLIMSTSDNIPASKFESCLSTLESINQSSFDNDGERGKALQAAYALVCQLESPWETICRLSMGQVKLSCD